jgi:hypothetical protein
MPIVRGTITEHGLIVELQVGVSEPRRDALLSVGFSIPGRITIKAVIDTGSAMTVVDVEILKQLDLTRIGTMSICTPSTGRKPHEADVYDVSLNLLHATYDFALPSLQIIATEFEPAHGYAGLIGRDVLKGCMFTYDGPHETFLLGY